jgi:hypothetical protein
LTGAPVSADSSERMGDGPRPAWATWWAILGVLALLVESVVRLGAYALRTLAQGLTLGQWVALAVATAAMCYAEGYRAFQRNLAPRLIARAHDVAHRRAALRWLAPLYVLSLVSETRSGVARAWVATALIVVAALAVRSLPAPWRGIADGAIAVALTWGAVAIALRFVTDARTRRLSRH